MIALVGNYLFSVPSCDSLVVNRCDTGWWT